MAAPGGMGAMRAPPFAAKVTTTTEASTGGSSTEMAQEDLEKWILSTARKHLMKDPSPEDNIPGMPVRHQPMAANLTY